jgi:hypothetical protein
VRAGGARPRRANKKAWAAGHLGTHIKVVPIDRQVLHAKLGDVLIEDWEKYRTRWIHAGARFIMRVSAAEIDRVSPL